MDWHYPIASEMGIKAFVRRDFAIGISESFSEIPSLLIDEQVELRKHGDYESLSRAWTRYYLASGGGVSRIWREHPGIGVACEYSRYKP